MSFIVPAYRKRNDYPKLGSMKEKKKKKKEDKKIIICISIYVSKKKKKKKGMYIYILFLAMIKDFSSNKQNFSNLSKV